MSLLQSINFIAGVELSPKLNSQVHKIQIHNRGLQFEADLYMPPKKTLGVIIFLHGMSVKGNQDPRIIKLSHSLAHTGYRVISPQFDDISQLRINRQQPYRIFTAIEAVCNDVNTGLGFNPAIMAPSFSASLALKAANNPAISKRLSALCLIGGYSEIESTVDYLLTDPDADDYGRSVILYNYFEKALGSQPAVSEALRLSIIANGSLDKNDELNLVTQLHALSTTEKEIYTRIKEDTQFRLMIKNKVFADQETLNEFAELEVLSSLDAVATPVCLIHGRQDNVISSKQSVLLHEKLQKLNKQSRLCISDLISHGDTGKLLNKIPEAWQLLQCFAWFFEQIQRRNLSMP